jgi:hypothetical protein
MIQRGVEAQDCRSAIVEAELQFGPQSTRTKRCATAQRTLTFQVLDDVFRVGPIVVMTVVANINFRRLCVAQRQSSKPTKHEIAAAPLETPLYTPQH